MSELMTPGVYIREQNAFPSSIVAVATAVPVFIGYTDKAERFGKSLINKPTRITSYAEYLENFGAGIKQTFTLVDPDPKAKQDTIIVNGKHSVLTPNDKFRAYLYNSIRLFYANGGSVCYILAVDTYGDKPTGFDIKPEDFIGSKDKESPFKILEKETEPTLIVMPDVAVLDADTVYKTIYPEVLSHCANMMSCFAILDVIEAQPTDTTATQIQALRDGIGTNFLNYGAVYYPWLQTGVVQASEVTFENLDATIDLATTLPEPAVKGIVEKYKTAAKTDKATNKNFHQSLIAASPTYTGIMDQLRAELNKLPASGAIAGIYTLVDNNKGVWKAPANVSLAMVNKPLVNISSEQQETLNVDVTSGKSINVIRPFPGVGTLVWGARTLDGNSQDWRYINVRRTLIMLEQSIKLATRSYVFESNNASTWVTVQGMIENFLNNLWKGGGLAGAKPEDAYQVQVGLGSTMTPQDILDGRMLISVRVALLKPAEFIVITFQQLMQQS